MKKLQNGNKRNRVIGFTATLSAFSILIYLFLGIAGVLWPENGNYAYAAISYVALFFSVILLLIKQRITPRRFFWETLFIGSSYISLFFLVYYIYSHYHLMFWDTFVALGNCATVIGFVFVFLDFVLELLAELKYPIYYS